MYKLIVIDLDGTMLNSQGEVTEETKQTIKQSLNEGIQIVLASGRPIDSIKAISEEVGINSYCIAGNGSMIYDMKEDKIIYENYMTKEKVLEIIEICEKNSITYNVYTETTILTTNLKFNVLYYYKENIKKEENKKTNISVVKNMYEYVKESKKEKFLKITICDENKSIFQSIVKKVGEIDDIKMLDISHMSRKVIKRGTEEVAVEYYYTEISANDVDKWNAIEFLAKELEIKKEEIITIGDNINDKKMIENAGLGIAMRGSAPEIINIANDITDTNNENGVAKVLQKYIL